MEFKHSKWKSSDSVQVNLKISHFNAKMKGKTAIRKSQAITWGRACADALKYIEKQTEQNRASKAKAHDEGQASQRATKLFEKVIQ